MVDKEEQEALAAALYAMLVAMDQAIQILTRERDSFKAKLEVLAGEVVQ